MIESITFTNDDAGAEKFAAFLKAHCPPRSPRAIKWSPEVIAAYESCESDLSDMMDAEAGDSIAEERDEIVIPDLHFGPSHIVFEDDNFEDRNIDYCIERCDAADCRAEYSSKGLDRIKECLLAVRAIPEANRLLRDEDIPHDPQHITTGAVFYRQAGDVVVNRSQPEQPRVSQIGPLSWREFMDRLNAEYQAQVAAMSIPPDILDSLKPTNYYPR